MVHHQRLNVVTDGI